MSGIRRSKHCRDSTLNSHLAMFSQLPCFGVYTNSSLSSNARALAGLKGLVQRRSSVRAQVVHHQRGPLRLRIVFFHQPAHPFRPCRRRMVGRHIGPAPIIKRGVVRLGTPHTKKLELSLSLRRSSVISGWYHELLRLSPVPSSCLMVLTRASRRPVGTLKPVDCIRCAENVVVLQNFLTRMALMGRGLPVMAVTRSQSRLRPTIHGCASPSPGDIERSLGGAIHSPQIWPTPHPQRTRSHGSSHRGRELAR